MRLKPSLNMAGPTGLEPATSGVTGRHSNQLNYDPAINLKYCLDSILWQLFKGTLANPLYSHFFGHNIKILFKDLKQIDGRRYRDRTCDPRLVRPVLSQLS